MSTFVAFRVDGIAKTFPEIQINFQFNEISFLSSEYSNSLSLSSAFALSRCVMQSASVSASWQKCWKENAGVE